MQQPFSDRRYTEAELTEILEEATRSEAIGDGGTDQPGGYTIEDIRAIAREAGIDPSHVDRAAAKLVASAEPARVSPKRSSLSHLVHEDLVTVVHEEIVIPRALSDEEMRSVVHNLESVVVWSGTLRQWGDWVEWRDNRNRLYLGVVRGSGLTRIRLIGNHSSELLAGAGAASFVGLLMLSSMGPVALLPIGAGVLGFSGIFWKWRTGATRRRLREILGILARSF